MQCLVVDDNLISRRLLVQLLARLGFCDTAVNGRCAIDAFACALEQKSPYKIVCLDVLMPGMDGREVLREMRRLEQVQGIQQGRGAKIVMVTAVEDRESILFSFRNECDAYLTKPITGARLMEALARAGVAVEKAAASPVAGSDLLAAARAYLLEAGGGEEAFADEVLSDYVGVLRAGIAKIRALCEHGQASLSASAAHALKGASLNVGLNTLAARCKDIELLAKHGDDEGVAVAIEDIAAFENALARARGMLSTGGAS